MTEKNQRQARNLMLFELMTKFGCELMLECEVIEYTHPPFFRWSLDWLENICFMNSDFLTVVSYFAVFMCSSQKSLLMQ